MALYFLYYKSVFLILYINLYFSSQLREKSKDFLYAGWEQATWGFLLAIPSRSEEG